MNDGEPGPVHQILLGLKGGKGVTVVAHSMTSDDEASSWQRKLEKHVRLLPWETETALPGKALSYYQFGSHAVVLRRWASGGSLGRSDAHALIGPTDVLTVPVALGLDSGLDWRRAADTVHTSRVGRELVNLAQVAVAKLRDQATHKPEILRRALGKLIDARAKPLTIIGCPDDDRVALTWALVHIGNQYLTKACQIHRKWTFSTYEIEDADSIPNIPEILFMPGKPTGRGVASREIVDVRLDEAVTQEAEKWSETLVERFVADEPLLPEFDDSIFVSARETMSSSTGQPEQRERESTPSQSISDRQQYQADSGGYPKEERQEAARYSPTLPVSTGHTFGPQRFEREIIDLLHSKDEYDFDRSLATLGQTTEDRTEIRGLLGVDDYLSIVVMVMRWHPLIEDRLDRFRRLRVTTFGPDGRDLADLNVAAYAAQIIAHPSAPDLFVHGLVQEIDAHGQSDRADPALAARWREQNKLAVPNFTGALSNVHRPLEPAQAGPFGAVLSFLTQRKWLCAAVVGLAVLAPLFFALGRYSVDTGTAGAGSNSAGNQATPSTSPAPAGADPAKRGIVELSGSVATNDLVIRGPSQAAEGLSVFLLLRTVDRDEIYPQGECQFETREWVCAIRPLTPPAGGPRGFEVLVVKVDPRMREDYQADVGKNKALPSQPDPKAVIFKISGLA